MVRTLLTTQLFVTKKYEAARKQLFKMGIKVESNDDVIICSTIKKHPANNNPFVAECNGLILDATTYAPVVIPPRSANTQFDAKNVEKLVQEGLYVVTPVHYGTTISLYYRNRWTISTTRGHTMNSVKWESKTYEEMLDDILKTLNSTFDEFTKTLDVNYCYTFVICHESLHYFDVKKSMNFIQRVSIDVDTDDYLFASMQELLVPSIEPIPFETVDAYIKNSAGALRQFIENGTVLLGYNLRAVDAQTENTPDLFIESSLMAYIRKTWHEQDVRNKSKELNVSHVDYVTAMSFLGNDSDKFIAVFPQYKEKYDVYSSKLDEYVTSMTSDSPDEKATLLKQGFYAEYPNYKDTPENLRIAYTSYVRHPLSITYFV